ncbi:hypothetical protein DB30_07004 [Enhygromyxa salina]|uniref:Uncharacterized protein n=1 Tax=Enhygromyxa salina TaxID=215803 RepID=A0A0C2CXC2_9BACT|nr:hypothetical protein DB30_07004 [Enhygromyxa salina]
MVGRRKYDRFVVECVHVLKKSHNNAFQLTQLMLVVPELRYSVKLVKKQHAGSTHRMFEE